MEGRDNRSPSDEGSHEPTTEDHGESGQALLEWGDDQPIEREGRAEGGPSIAGLQARMDQMLTYLAEVMKVFQGNANCQASTEVRNLAQPSTSRVMIPGLQDESCVGNQAANLKETGNWGTRQGGNKLAKGRGTIEQDRGSRSVEVSDSISHRRTDSTTSGMFADADGSMKELWSTMQYGTRKPPKFSGGSCDDYWEFKKIFQCYTAGSDLSYNRRLEMLVEAYNGDVSREIRACLCEPNAKKGYDMAMGILEERYGDRVQLIHELINKVTRGPPVKLTDVASLQGLVNDLRRSIKWLEEMKCLHEIDTCESMGAIARRFVGKVREYYDERHHEYEKDWGDSPRITWMLDFVKDMLSRARKMAREKSALEWTGKHQDSSRTTPAKKLTALATVVEGVEVEREDQGSRSCGVCQGSHYLRECTIFQHLPMGARIDVLRQQGRCFSCLERGHLIRNCGQSSRCGIDGCRYGHSRLVHGAQPLGVASQQGRNTEDTLQGKRFRNQFEPHAKTSAKRVKVSVKQEAPIQQSHPQTRVVSPHRSEIIQTETSNAALATTAAENATKVELQEDGEKQPREGYKAQNF